MARPSASGLSRSSSPLRVLTARAYLRAAPIVGLHQAVRRLTRRRQRLLGGGGLHPTDYLGCLGRAELDQKRPGASVAEWPLPAEVFLCDRLSHLAPLK